MLSCRGHPKCVRPVQAPAQRIDRTVSSKNGNKKNKQKRDKNKRWVTRKEGGWWSVMVSSVVIFRVVQSHQVIETHTKALHVEGVDFSFLAVQQVFDSVSALFLKRSQLLFNLLFKVCSAQ